MCGCLLHVTAEGSTPRAAWHGPKCWAASSTTSSSRWVRPEGGPLAHAAIVLAYLPGWLPACLQGHTLLVDPLGSSVYLVGSFDAHNASSYSFSSNTIKAWGNLEGGWGWSKAQADKTADCCRTALLRLLTTGVVTAVCLSVCAGRTCGWPWPTASPGPWSRWCPTAAPPSTCPLQVTTDRLTDRAPLLAWNMREPLTSLER